MKPTSKIAGYIELAKPRILTLILVTTGLGFFLGSRGHLSLPQLMLTLWGAGMVCAGASALNHYLERDVDCRMLRTRNRPIPAGLISPGSALSYGILLVLAGVSLLAVKVNILTAFLSLLTAFLYVLVYTPMKKVSWLNTTIGAIPGALPPLGGWAAATNHLDFGGWILFLILFIWQHPHFYAIAWMLKDDYRQAGFKMLPVVYPDGRSTFAQILVFSFVLIPTSILPTLNGMSGTIYLVGAVILSSILAIASLTLASSRSLQDARKLLKTTVIYLPLLLILIMIDSSF